jgi:translation initiation factor 4E transporter
MQNALIRKKLEEQRENYRKRQEQEKQEIAKKSQQDSAPSSSSENISNSDQVVTTSAPAMGQDEKIIQLESPTKKAPIAQQSQQRQHAPSPSIFTLTPTSVLRKMTAEKESDASKIEKKKLLAQSQQQQQLQQQGAMRNQQQPSQQPPFMGNSMSQMDRLKMAQNDAQGMQFGSINAWNTPPIQDMKPIGKY